MSMMRLALPLALLTVSGFAQDVRYNFAQGTDFSKYKTYKWGEAKDQQKLDQMVDQQLRSAIDAELAKKGLTKVTGDNADLVTVMQVAVNTEKEFSSYSSDFGYGPGWGGGWYRGGGMGSTTTTGQTSTIYVGSVGVDMYDSAAKQLVWRGVATKTLDAKAKPDKRQKNIAKGVAKLFKNYPPPQKKK